MKNTIQKNPRKTLIVSDNMIADMLSNNKFNPIVTEVFVWGRKLNSSLAFITPPYFAVSKNSTHYFAVKIPNKRELQQIALNHLSDIDFQDFMILYKMLLILWQYFFTYKIFIFINFIHIYQFIDTILASDNSSCFRKNLLERI